MWGYSGSGNALNCLRGTNWAVWLGIIALLGTSSDARDGVRDLFALELESVRVERSCLTNWELGRLGSLWPQFLLLLQGN